MKSVYTVHRSVVVEICLQAADVTDSWLLTGPAAPCGGAVSKGCSQDTHKRLHDVMISAAAASLSCCPLLLEVRTAPLRLCRGSREAWIQSSRRELFSDMHEEKSKEKNKENSQTYTVSVRAAATTEDIQ